MGFGPDLKRVPQVRALGVSLWRNDLDRPIRLSEGLEIMPKGDATLSWALSGDGLQQVWRMSEAQDSAKLQRQEESRAKWWSFTLVLGVLFSVVLGRIAVGRADSESQHGPPPWWKDAIVWLILALVWTWPAALAGPESWGATLTLWEPCG